MAHFVRLTSLVIALGLAGAVRAAQNDCAPAIDRLAPFLDSYAKADEAAVLAMVDPDVVVFGSDVAERFEGRSGVRRMLAGDQALWRGRARIGAPTAFSAVGGGKLCVLTFQAPFALGQSPPVTVRFTMTWRLGPSGWRLAQSANSVPTVGQSAGDLLRGG